MHVLPNEFALLVFNVSKTVEILLVVSINQKNND